MAWAVVALLLAPPFDEVEFGKTTAQRVKLLRHKNQGVRRQAALLLAHADADGAIAGLLVALSDPAPGVRRAVARALLRIGDERAVPFLARRIREEGSARVLPAMVLALARCGGSYAARHVLPYLEHPRREVRAAAAAAVGMIGDAGQRDALWAALRYAPDDPGFRVRSAVLGALVALGWKEDARNAVLELEKMGARRHWVSRAALVAAVGAIGMKERLDWVRGELETGEDPRIVAAAAGSLARLGLKDEVLAQLGHASPLVRRASLVALQEAGDPRATVRARIMVQEDRDPAVRFEAALVLHHARDPVADVYLVDALRSRDPLFWISALAALEQAHGRSFGRDPEAWAAYLRQR